MSEHADISAPRIKIVCTEPGAFHDRYGRTVVASFTRQEAGYLDPWQEDKIERDAARYRKHPGSLLGIDQSTVLGGIKPTRVTRMGTGGRRAPKRAVGRAHLDLRCRGCGLARREPGAKLWAIFDDLAAGGRSRIELRDLIARLNDSPTGQE